MAKIGLETKKNKERVRRRETLRLHIESFARYKQLGTYFERRYTQFQTRLDEFQKNADQLGINKKMEKSFKDRLFQDSNKVTSDIFSPREIEVLNVMLMKMIFEKLSLEAQMGIYSDLKLDLNNKMELSDLLCDYYKRSLEKLTSEEKNNMEEWDLLRIEENRLLELRRKMLELEIKSATTLQSLKDAEASLTAWAKSHPEIKNWLESLKNL